MLEWGDALIKELAARRCIVFLGAGASAGCEPQHGGKRPPTWSGLLTILVGKIRNHEEEKKLAEGLIAELKYLDAAEVILSSLNRADYVDAMRHIFEQPRYQPSDIHRAVLKIDPKIVITTNYDTVYDWYCRQGIARDGYNIFKYTDNHLVSQLRSPIRCVIKAHGCITDPDTMVLTRSEYFSAKQKSPHFFKVLDALFLTHTILFVGYSLTDPDIQITLENANISARSSHRHYFVTESGAAPALKKAWEKTYNVEVLEFPAADYVGLNQSLDGLAEKVLEYRLDNPDL
ncbi:SIR2 family protein [Massilia sp. P8910]|uniref:SIR2 family protein n=1 Tax=Massilia antarctica TaxID=2765360 RepID=UPI001E54D43F|nr:SIR2 family protein [Massilia antarctica]MCE3606999.1 SIR2 family protein [Massilia antarctica]